METVIDRLARHAKERSDAPAYAEMRDRRWSTTSWHTFDAQVRTAARALVALGLPVGGTVALFGFNRPRWTLSSLATMAAGGAPAGVYQTCAPNQVAYILGHAGSRVAIVEHREQLAKVRQVRDQLPALAWVVLMDHRGIELRSGELSWDEFVARAGEAPADVLAERRAAVDPDGLATLIYTSGTTGTPKAVMLSHRNIAETGRIGAALHDLKPEDRVLSYLPLAHIAEQMISVHIAVTVGYAVYFAESPERLADNLRQVQPTLFFGVPRVWERIDQAIRQGLASSNILRRALGGWALTMGRRVAERRRRGRGAGFLALPHLLADRLVLAKVRHRLGMAHVRIAASGAAPIASEVLDRFHALGITILEVYGLSETCGPTTWNTHDRFRLGTVGPALPEVEVRIADDDEIQVRGPNVFRGYLRDPEATAEAFTDDGWFCTGDLGTFDDQGFLSVTGRKKDLLITSGGKNIAPSGIEQTLCQLPLVAEAIVLGDGHRFLTALLGLDAEAVARFAVEHGLESNTPEGLCDNETVRAEIARGIDEVNGRLARVETVRDFRLLPRNLSLDEDELTPTLKIRRQVVTDHFAPLIAEMYPEDS